MMIIVVLLALIIRDFVDQMFIMYVNSASWNPETEFAFRGLYALVIIGILWFLL